MRKERMRRETERPVVGRRVAAVAELGFILRGMELGFRRIGSIGLRDGGREEKYIYVCWRVAFNLFQRRRVVVLKLLLKINK